MSGRHTHMLPPPLQGGPHPQRWANWANWELILQVDDSFRGGGRKSRRAAR